MVPASFPGWNRRIVPWLAAGAATVLVVATFHPGYMSLDSIDQLSQARAGVFSDWHPPAMAWLWRQIDRVFPGPGGMLLIQNLCFSTALALVFGTLFPPLPAGILVLGVVMLPPVFGLLSTIWKDVELGATALMAFALLLRYSVTRSRWHLAASVIPIFWTCAVRQNGAAAIAPMTAWAAWLLRDALPWRTAPLSRWLSASLGFLACVAFFLLGTGWNSLLASTRLHPEQALYLHDLTAVSLARNEDLLPDYLRNDPSVATLDELRQIFRHDSAAPLLWNSKRHLRFSQNEQHLADLRKRWQTAILHNPGAYLRHRLELTRHLLSLGTENPENVFFEATPRPSRLTAMATRVLRSTASTLLFSGWLYLLMAGGALFIGRMRRIPTEWFLPMVVLATSGLFYSLPYAVLAPAVAFRYLWWTAVASLLCLLFAFAPRKPAASPRNGGESAPAGLGGSSPLAPS